MKGSIDAGALDQMFRKARTFYKWRDRAPLDEAQLRELYALTSLPPTSANAQPGRFVFLVSAEAKRRLEPALSPMNVEKTMTSGATVIVAHDSRFYDNLPRTFPHADARSWFADKPALAEITAFRNGTLQGAYLILAARALGLDVGPMSGFDNVKVDAEFFPDGRWRSNFLVNLGQGDPAQQYPRDPRLPFEEAARIL